MADAIKRYQGERVEVTFDARRRLHAGRCVSRLPEVFDANRRPWILPDDAQLDGSQSTAAPKQDSSEK